MVDGCDVRVEVVGTKGVNQTGTVLRDMRVAQVFAHHESVLELRQGVIVGLSGAGLGELDEQFIQQLCHLVVDVFRTVARMKAKDDKREPIQQLPDDW